MLPTVSTFRIPKLPEINCDPDDEEEGEDEKRNPCDGFESDEDIEILLRKTKFLRHSKSAHADLALPENSKRKTAHLSGYGIEVCDFF